MAIVLLLGGLACGCVSQWQQEVRSAVSRGDAEAAVEAYDELREAEGPDPGALARVASAVLQEAARSDDPALRDAALMELTRAGVDAEPVLERLADAPDVDAPVRARALSVLASRGRRGRRAQLRPLLDHEDPEVVAWAVTTLDPRRETSRAVERLGHPAASVREAAARILAEAPRSAAVRRALADVARRDPVPGVRAAAAQALAAQGAEAVPALEGALQDRHRGVQGAAAGALLRVGTPRAQRAVERALAWGPSHASVEVARRVLSGTPDPPPPESSTQQARLHLVAALRSGSGPLRAQAAVAIRAIPGHAPFDDALREALQEEPDDGVRLHLAHALVARGDTRPELADLLRTLAAEENMPAVRAAAVLAGEGDTDAPDRLARFLSHDDPPLRVAAARGLACDGASPDRARSILKDPAPLARVQGAGAILRCA